MSVPYPYTQIDVNKGWLACHPGGMSPTKDTSIAGKNTFITAFGSTYRKDFHPKVRYQCTTNSYGPVDSIYEYCHSKCHKEVKDEIEVQVSGQQKRGLFANPSLADPICETFRKDMLKEVQKENNKNMGKELTAEGYSLDNKYNFLGWVKIKERSSGKDTLCYPHAYSEGLSQAQNMFDFPYRHGWCKVCKQGNLHNCKPEPDKNWGWCQPACEEGIQDLKSQDDEAHEAIVDAFVYENCSKSIDTFSEFCTGERIVSGYGQVSRLNCLLKSKHIFLKVWLYDDTYKHFIKIRNELRKYHEETGWNQNNTILRPGARYQAIQHSNALGDACYGDAGGSVWKFWTFRERSSKPDRRTYRLAVLTGVISRSVICIKDILLITNFKV